VSELRVANNVQIPVSAACELATECWRLRKLNNASFLYASDRLVLERSVRRLSEVLGTFGVRSIDFLGTAYDPGMAPEVLEAHSDSSLLPDTSVIDETILPTIIWNGTIIQAGQVVVRQAIKKEEHAGDLA
jgi:hypothetical protein